jgi:hypothetical protein
MRQLCCAAASYRFFLVIPAKMQVSAAMDAGVKLDWFVEEQVRLV